MRSPTVRACVRRRSQSESPCESAICTRLMLSTPPTSARPCVPPSIPAASNAATMLVEQASTVEKAGVWPSSPASMSTSRAMLLQPRLEATVPHTIRSGRVPAASCAPIAFATGTESATASRARSPPSTRAKGVLTPGTSQAGAAELTLPPWRTPGRKSGQPNGLGNCVSRTTPTNTARPIQWLWRKARKQPSRERSRIQLKWQAGDDAAAERGPRSRRARSLATRRSAAITADEERVAGRHRRDVEAAEEDGRGLDAELQVVFAVHHRVLGVVGEHPEDVGRPQQPRERRHVARLRGEGHRDAEAEAHAQPRLRHGEEALGERVDGRDDARHHGEARW